MRNHDVYLKMKAAQKKVLTYRLFYEKTVLLKKENPYLS